MKLYPTHDDYDAATLLIKGTLNATGTANAPIVFTKYGDTSMRGESFAIVFRGANLTSSILDYVTVSELSGALSFEVDSPSNDDLGPLRIAHSTFASLWMRNHASSKLTFDHSTITSSYIDAAGGELTCTDSTLTDVKLRGRERVPFMLKSVQMTRGSLGSYMGVITVEDSTLTGVGTDDVYSGGGGTCALSFTRCTLTDPHLVFAGALFAQDTAFSWSVADRRLAFWGGTLAHSSFTGNVSGAGLEIGSNPSLSISDSVFTGNRVGIKLSGNGSSPTIAQCNLAGNTQFAVEDHMTHAVTAANNWWGTTNTQQIDQAIFDGTEELDADFVNYAPPLSAANPNAGPQ